MTYNDKNFQFKPNIKEILAKNIRKYRIEKGYTQEQLAVYTDRSFEFIRKIETDYGQRGFLNRNFISHFCCFRKRYEQYV